MAAFLKIAAFALSLSTVGAIPTRGATSEMTSQFKIQVSESHNNAALQNTYAVYTPQIFNGLVLSTSNFTTNGKAASDAAENFTLKERHLIKHDSYGSEAAHMVENHAPYPPGSTLEFNSEDGKTLLCWIAQDNVLTCGEGVWTACKQHFDLMGGPMGYAYVLGMAQSEEKAGKTCDVVSLKAMIDSSS